jgi:hypothetical protein
MPLLDVRRREFLDPALLHSGPEGIQRMADAVSLGGNPMSFAAAPALIASPPERVVAPATTWGFVKRDEKSVSAPKKFTSFERESPQPGRDR